MKIIKKFGFIKIILVLLSFSLLLQTLLRVTALSTNVFDLGIFSNNFSNINVEFYRSILGHVQPLMLPWGAFYNIFPNHIAPFVIVGAQTITILVSIWYVYRAFGIWAGASMLLYYPVWANSLLGFHFDHLSIALLTLFFVTCEKQNYKLAAFAAASLVLVKEPFSLQVIFCGLYLIWLAFREQNKIFYKLLLWLSSILISLGVVWFYISMYKLIPIFSGVQGIQGDAYAWLGSGTLEKLSTVIFSPNIWLLEIFNNVDKLKLLLVIFGSLAFIPLLSPAPLIIALPPLLIMMLSNEDNYYSYANHYTAGIIVPVIVAFKNGIPIAFETWRRLLSYCYIKNKYLIETLPKLLIIICILFSHWALSPSPISRLFWSDKVFDYSWKAYVPSKRDTMIKDALIKYIPSDPEISVSSQNSLNFSHLSNRKLYLAFPEGVFDPHLVPSLKSEINNNLNVLNFQKNKKTIEYENKYVDFVVLDSLRPWFLMDQGCDWLYGKCYNDRIASKYLKAVEKTKDTLKVVFENDGFIILQRLELDVKGEN